MKLLKKDASSFKKLNATQLGKVKGGQWVEITTEDGKKTTIWI